MHAPCHYQRSQNQRISCAISIPEEDASERNASLKYCEVSSREKPPLHILTQNGPKLLLSSAKACSVPSINIMNGRCESSVVIVELLYIVEPAEVPATCYGSFRSCCGQSRAQLPYFPCPEPLPRSKMLEQMAMSCHPVEGPDCTAENAACDT